MASGRVSADTGTESSIAGHVTREDRPMRAQRINHEIYGQPVLPLSLDANGQVFARTGESIGRVIHADSRNWYSIDTRGDVLRADTRTGAVGILVHASLYRVRSIFDVWYPLACASADRADEARPLGFDELTAPESLDQRLARTDAMRRARGEAKRTGERGEAMVATCATMATSLVGLAVAPLVMLGMVGAMVALLALATRHARPERQSVKPACAAPDYADAAEGACEGPASWEAAWSDLSNPPVKVYAL
jgi:hypothetical protein